MIHPAQRRTCTPSGRCQKLGGRRWSAGCSSGSGASYRGSSAPALEACPLVRPMIPASVFVSRRGAGRPVGVPQSRLRSRMSITRMPGPGEPTRRVFGAVGEWIQTGAGAMTRRSLLVGATAGSRVTTGARPSASIAGRTRPAFLRAATVRRKSLSPIHLEAALLRARCAVRLVHFIRGRGFMASAAR